MHRVWLGKVYKRYGTDPHLQQNPEYLIASTFNVPNLTKSWHDTLMRLLDRGKVLFNCCGGMMALDGAVTILKTIKRKEFVWPEDDKPETITISRWPDGIHYYLTSSLNREFPNKYKSLSYATKIARRYVDADNVIIKNPGFRYKRDGG
jgi:hypothetical protein